MEEDLDVLSGRLQQRMCVDSIGFELWQKWSRDVQEATIAPSEVNWQNLVSAAGFGSGSPQRGATVQTEWWLERLDTPVSA